MKVRSGFVSNSSSSSFMIAIGVVNNWDKFIKWFDKIGENLLYPSDLRLIDPTKDNFVSTSKEGWHISSPTNHPELVELSKYSLNDATSSIPAHIKAKNLLSGQGEKSVVALCFGNDEGDSSFIRNVDTYGIKDVELNHDIDLDWFSTEQQEIFNGFGPENGIIHVDKKFGAGRNG